MGQCLSPLHGSALNDRPYRAVPASLASPAPGLGARAPSVSHWVCIRPGTASLPSSVVLVVLPEGTLAVIDPGLIRAAVLSCVKAPKEGEYQYSLSHV